MSAINFLKYDFRKSKHLFLLSILVFAPLGAMMGGNMESSLGIFSYMALVVVIAPTSLFTYEQKADCGFDGLLPAKERDKVFGRYMLGAVDIAFELGLGMIVSLIMSKVAGLKLFDMGLVIKGFVAITLMYLSVAFGIYYLVGRNLNQQIRSIMVMLPALIIWGAINSLIGIATEGDIAGVLVKIIENKETISALAVGIGVAMYILSALISTQIIKKKDYS